MLNQFCYGEFPLLQIPQMKSFKQSIWVESKMMHSEGTYS
jgi:hypothetical protein